MVAKAQFALMLITLTLASSAQEQKHNKPKPLPEDRVVDTYAVYDAALPKPLWSTTAPNRAKYYIVDRAVRPNSSWQPEKCMHPPDELRGKVSEMLADLAAQPDEYALESRFKLEKPYELVSFDLTERWKGTEGEPPPGTEITQLGVVSFSKDRSLASVVVWRSCGRLCGGSRWMVFTRGEKGWEEQSWSGCGAIL